MRHVLIGILLFTAPAFGTEYIVQGKGIKDSVSIESVKHRKMKNFDAIVTELSDEQVAEWKAKGYTVEVNGKVHALGHPSSEQFEMGVESTTKVWGVAAIHAPQANKLKNGSGEGVTVCVVDTGAATDHPELAGQVIGGAGIVKSTTPGKEEYYDDMGHGTHVSCTIAAKGVQIPSVAHKAKIYAVKVLDADGSGTDADVADGIKACIGHAQVINMSLGGSQPSPIIQAAMKAAKKAGIMIACAAGNDPGPIGYPAKYPECKAITAIDSQMHIASFSSTGPETAFAAPGVKVYSCLPGGKYEAWDGTSMATPHVAAVMAIAKSRKKASVKATKLIGLTRNQQGAGRVDALKTAQ